MPVYPAGEMVVTGDGNPPRPANLQMIWSLESGGARSPAAAVGRRAAGRTVPLGRRRPQLGTGALAVGPARAEPVVRRRLRPCRYPFAVRRPAVLNCVRLAISTAGVWVTKDAGGDWQLVGTGLIGRYMPPEMQGMLLAQDVIAWCSARRRPTTCGFSTTAACSARAMAG
ncbi:MAG: hypothetical protein U0736_08760 [Gemmataceae bacterium]